MTAPWVRTPRDVPELRLWIRDQWAPGNIFSTVAARSMIKRSPTEAPDPEAWARWERITFEHATLWWVGEDMVDLLLASARDVPDDVRIDEVPSPASAGFVVFAKPWWGIDSDDPSRQVQVDAFVWGGAILPPTLRPGIPAEGQVTTSISSYRRLNFGDGLSPGELELATMTGSIALGRPEGSGRSFSLHGEAWSPLGRSDWPTTDLLSDLAYPMTETMHRSYIEDRKILVALWTLLHQEGIASTIVEHADRPTRRRAQRAGLDPNGESVRVVTLRRIHRTESAPAEGSDEHIEWSHRWLVSGHWRWQRVGPGRAERRLTFVRPYVKGPDNLPLVVPETVKAWVR